ncbi:MAG: hypothetical protein V4622_10945 [Bacteroidota bacterium]
METENENNRWDDFLNPEHESIIEPKIISGKKFSNEKLSDYKKFKPSILNKTLITVFGVGGAVFLCYICIIHKADFIFLFMFFLFAALLGIKIWIADAKNILIVSKSGISNNEFNIKWEDIKSIHISYISRGRMESDSFLIVKLKNGKNNVLELTKINFKNFLTDNSSYDEEVLGHYIERYKQLAQLDSLNKS